MEASSISAFLYDEEDDRSYEAVYVCELDATGDIVSAVREDDTDGVELVPVGTYPLEGDEGNLRFAIGDGLFLIEWTFAGGVEVCDNTGEVISRPLEWSLVSRVPAEVRRQFFDIWAIDYTRCPNPDGVN